MNLRTCGNRLTSRRKRSTGRLIQFLAGLIWLAGCAHAPNGGVGPCPIPSLAAIDAVERGVDQALEIYLGRIEKYCGRGGSAARGGSGGGRGSPSPGPP